MPSKVFSAAIIGLEAEIVEVEVSASYGLRHFVIVATARIIQLVDVRK